MTETRARIRGPDRRAECRQVHAAEPDGRRQGFDRHPQGADDAGANPRRRDRGAGPDRLRGHAGPFPAAPQARPGDGRGRVERRRRRRSGRPAGRGAPRDHAGCRSHPRRADGTHGRPPRRSGDQQDRPGRGAVASGADPGAERAVRLRADVPDLGRKGTWRRRLCGNGWRRSCRKGRGSIRRIRSPICRCA